jgi:hypothetical protein
MWWLAGNGSTTDGAPRTDGAVRDALFGAGRPEGQADRFCRISGLASTRALHRNRCRVQRSQTTPKSAEFAARKLGTENGAKQKARAAFVGKKRPARAHVSRLCGLGGAKALARKMRVELLLQAEPLMLGRDRGLDLPLALACRFELTDLLAQDVELLEDATDGGVVLVLHRLARSSHAESEIIQAHVQPASHFNPPYG